METWNKPANVNISEGRGFESILEILITIGAGINRFLICHATDSLRTAKFHFIEERSSLFFFWQRQSFNFAQRCSLGESVFANMMQIASMLQLLSIVKLNLFDKLARFVREENRLSYNEGVIVVK